MPKSFTPLRRDLLLTAGAVLVGLAVLAALTLGPGRDTAAKALARQLVARIEAAGGSVGDWRFDAAESRLRLRKLTMTAGEWTVAAAGLDLSLTASALTGTLERVEGEGIIIVNNVHGTYVARAMLESVAIPPGLLTGEQGLDWRDLSAASVTLEQVVIGPQPDAPEDILSEFLVTETDRVALAGIVDGIPSHVAVSGLRGHDLAETGQVSLDRLDIHLMPDRFVENADGVIDLPASLAALNKVSLGGGTLSEQGFTVRLESFDFEVVPGATAESYETRTDLVGLVAGMTPDALGADGKALETLLTEFIVGFSDRTRIGDGTLSTATRIDLGSRAGLRFEMDMTGIDAGFVATALAAPDDGSTLPETARLHRMAVTVTLAPNLLTEFIDAVVGAGRASGNINIQVRGISVTDFIKSLLVNRIRGLESIPGLEAADIDAMVTFIEGGGRLNVVARWPEGLPLPSHAGEAVQAELRRVLPTGDITITRDP